MPRHRFTDTKERIERAAIGLFVQKGVTETTIRDIAQTVDISEGALYRHFVGKEELVWQLFERHYVAFAGRLQALADGEPTARGKLSAMIRGFCQAHDDDPTLFHFLLFVQHGQLSKLGADTPTPVTVMHGVLSRAIDAGEIPAQDVNLAIAFAMGIVLQPMTFAAYGRLPQAQAPNAERLIAAAWAAVTSL